MAINQQDLKILILILMLVVKLVILEKKMKRVSSIQELFKFTYQLKDFLK